MPLPLFDNVVVDAVPKRDEPVRTPSTPVTPHTSAARLSPPPFELDDPRPKSHRPATIARVGTPEYHAYWSAFRKALDGQSAPGPEHDPQITQYLRDGYRLGQLARRRPPKE